MGTGALVLAAAGLLAGLGASSRPQRWVQDGRFLTSAGGSAGIDLALALVARLTDEPTARMVQLANRPQLLAKLNT